MKLNKESALADMTRFVQEFGRFPTKADCRETEWLQSANQYQRILGHREDYSYILEEYLEKHPKPIPPEKHCLYCDAIVNGWRPKDANVFCNTSCAAKYNNPRKPPRERKTEKEVKVVNTVYKLKEVVKYNKCVHCSATLVDNQKIFCSLQCHADHRLALSIQAWLTTGKVKRWK